MLDATDVLLYSFALNTLRNEFHLSNAQAGAIASLTLVFAAAGGILSGVLADRFGRTKLLAATVLLYSLGSGGTALSTGMVSLLFWRSIVGLGLGGEWAVGAVLVAETWPAALRLKAMSWMQSGWAIGYLLAAGLTAAILPRFGWRPLFLAGLCPALLAIAIRRGVQEPQSWIAQPKTGVMEKFRQLFQPPLLVRTVWATLLSTSVLFAYWGLFTWLPGFLSAPQAQGGAGLSILRTSAFVVPTQVGAFCGYLSFGWLAGKLGRRPAFVLYMVAAALLVPIYGLSRSVAVLVPLGFFVGFFGTGYFSLFGAVLAELYPAAVRATGQGFTYNLGRSVSAAAPLLVGTLADRNGIGAALAINSAFFLLAAILVFRLPRVDCIEPPQ